MLKHDIEKKSIKKKTQKITRVTSETCQTCVLDHETGITL
jgi:hypothetical protein